MPWIGDPFCVALHQPRIKLHYQDDGATSGSAGVDIGGATKIPMGIRTAAGATEFDEFCLDTFGYLPQEVSVTWAPPLGEAQRFHDERASCPEHKYLLFRHLNDLVPLKLKYGYLIWR